MKTTTLLLALGLAAPALLFTSCATPPPPVTIYEVRPTPTRTTTTRPIKHSSGGYSGSAEGFMPVERPSSYSN